jgi:ribose transport system substrate-binding protein
VTDYTTMKEGVDYYPDLTADFFAPNTFPPCGLSFTAPQLMAQSGENQQ